MKTYKPKILIILLGVLILLFLAGCQQADKPVSESPEEREVAALVDELNEIDALDQGLNQDSALEELDNLIVE